MEPHLNTGLQLALRLSTLPSPPFVVQKSPSPSPSSKPASWEPLGAAFFQDDLQHARSPGGNTEAGGPGGEAGNSNHRREVIGHPSACEKGTSAQLFHSTLLFSVPLLSKPLWCESLEPLTEQ